MPDTRNDLLRVLHAIPDSTQHQLAERMDITVRTVRRHVCELEKSGDVLVSKDGHRNQYRLSPGTHPIPPIPQLTELEAEALTVAAQAGLGVLRPTPFAGPIERAVEKLEGAWLQEVFRRACARSATVPASPIAGTPSALLTQRFITSG